MKMKQAGLTALLLAPASLLAAEADTARRIDALEVELDSLRNELREQVEAAGEWKHPDSLVHLAGYASVGYASTDQDDGSFSAGGFSPIFHFQYRDLVMLESELEVELSPEGETEVNLEYLTVDFFPTDNVAIVAGRFLSPVGQFRQNLHPSWINRLPSAPPGFGHDGAAPVSETGLQARGGVDLGAGKLNYAVYIGNGPELNAVDEDGEVELEGIEAEGFGADRDGNKVVGGRLGFIPRVGLEIGLSAATGKAAVTALVDEAAGTRMDVDADPAHDYDVLGADFAWQWNNAELRGEYVQSKIGSNPASIAVDGATWSTWYLQGAYRFAPTRWEGVLRYGDFDSPHPTGSGTQWAIGANYRFAANIVAKLAWEANDGGVQGGQDRILVQLAYGF